MVSANIIERVDALQLAYIRALDNRDMAGWADCFGDPGAYVCIARENEEQSLQLAIMLDDNRERILDRVTYVTKIWVGIFEDYRTRHFVQRVRCVAKSPSLVEVESNFMVAYTTTKGRSEILVAGSYTDEIVIDGASARFRSKRAVLDTDITPRYLVYPV